jgi:asparagine synthase (glutamine-hydrolysing)
MCGITGIVDLNERKADHRIGLMTSRLRHWGPGDEGYFLLDMLSGKWMACAGEETAPSSALPRLDQHCGNGACDLALGHCWWSVLDLSSAGHGPMKYLDGQLWITYNGEINNYRELRGELRQKGYSFETGTDTEVILAAYAERGPDWLRHFNGM